MDLPITCTLSEVYELPFGSDTLTMLARLVALEHGCCPFLTFRIALEAGAETVTLEVTGHPKQNP